MGRPGSRAGNNANAERLKMLKSKKERLNHTLERLALQAGHKVCVFCDQNGGLMWVTNEGWLIGEAV